MGIKRCSKCIEHDVFGGFAAFMQRPRVSQCSCGISLVRIPLSPPPSGSVRYKKPCKTSSLCGFFVFSVRQGIVTSGTFGCRYGYLSISTHFRSTQNGQTDHSSCPQTNRQRQAQRQALYPFRRQWLVSGDHAFRLQTVENEMPDK